MSKTIGENTVSHFIIHTWDLALGLQQMPLLTQPSAFTRPWNLQVETLESESILPQFQLFQQESQPRINQV